MKQITKDTVLKQGDKSFEQFLAENPYKHTRSFTEADWEADMYEKWKETIKTYTAIETEQGIVWIDKDAEIKDYDYHIPYLVDGKIGTYDNHTDWTHLDCPPIIASNFILEGIPVIGFEDEVEKLARIEYEKILHKHITYSDFVLAFSIGYKANQAKYTEEDILDAYEAGKDSIHFKNDGSWCWWEEKNGEKDYLQSLNSIKEITVDENFKAIK